MSNRSIYYVYVLFDYLGVPRYVGKGKGARDLDHERYPTSGKNWLKKAFLKKTIEEGKNRGLAFPRVPVVRLQEGLTEHSAHLLEKMLVKIIGRIDRETGSLTNLTDAGEGLTNWADPSLRRQIAFKASLASAQRSPEKRKESALRSVASQTVEQRKAKSRKSQAAQTREQRCINMNYARSFVTSDVYKENGSKISAVLLNKKLSLISKKAASIGLERNSIVTVLVKNPKKFGSKAYKLYELYGPVGSRISVGDYRKIAGYSAYAAIYWDLERGYISVEPVSQVKAA